MRTRLCYLALLLLPLCAYWPVLVHEFASPEDLLRLNAPDVLAADGALKGILHGALQDVAFHSVDSVFALAFLRGLSLLLVVLCGLALYQVTERGGWAEVDAAALAVSVMLLPAAQLYVAWAAAWPAVLAALLSLAAFAATESELELGGTRRFVGLIGGVLLYFGAAMCYLPNSTMGLVPLAALTLSRPLRLSAELKGWFGKHLAVMLAGLLVAGALERWLMDGAGVVDRTELVGRLESLLLFALPAGWAGFFVGEAGMRRAVCTILGVAVMGAMVVVARRSRQVDPRAGQAWGLALALSPAIFGLVALLAPNWHGGYRSLWPLGGIAVVGLLASVRGAGEQSGPRAVWRHALQGGVVLAGVLVAAIQVTTLLVKPLEREWSELRTAVMRAPLVGEVEVGLRLPSADVESVGVPEARFDARVARHPAAAMQMFNAALDDRFPSGLAKGTKVKASVLPAGAKAPPGGLLFELRLP